MVKYHIILSTTSDFYAMAKHDLNLIPGRQFKTIVIQASFKTLLFKC